MLLNPNNPRRQRFYDKGLEPEPVPEKGEMHTELPCDIYLLMGLTSDERMEAAIRCAVDLGVYEVIPVEMKNCTVKADPAKIDRKRTHWQTLCDETAKASGRNYEPHIHRLMPFSEAVLYARSVCDFRLVPHEDAGDGQSVPGALKNIQPNKAISVFIGPDNGFAEDETELLKKDMDLVSLGKHVLRNDTAAVCAMYLVARELEKLKS